ncbi:LacI family DNA-binding transcriptional regulator [Nonomuraea rubra]|uniref:LacI family DNA-binding transcriptional regulator n=1 Tax=Nonomuraea rubra TaxID=46180 RepID=UPI0036196106
MVRRAASEGGERRPTTIRDVAAHAGVSVATVSRILSGSYPSAPATRSKVMKAVRELDYVANANARNLAGASSRSVAIIVNSVVSPTTPTSPRGCRRRPHLRASCASSAPPAATRSASWPPCSSCGRSTPSA